MWLLQVKLRQSPSAEAEGIVGDQRQNALNAHVAPGAKKVGFHIFLQTAVTSWDALKSSGSSLDLKKLGTRQTALVMCSYDDVSNHSTLVGMLYASVRSVMGHIQ